MYLVNSKCLLIWNVETREYNITSRQSSQRSQRVPYQGLVWQDSGACKKKKELGLLYYSSFSGGAEIVQKKVLKKTTSMTILNFDVISIEFPFPYLKLQGIVEEPIGAIILALPHQAKRLQLLYLEVLLNCSQPGCLAEHHCKGCVKQKRSRAKRPLKKTQGTSNVKKQSLKQLQ